MAYSSLMGNMVVMFRASAISRRRALALGAGAFASMAPQGWAGLPRPVVVELFTSQGCSSCPPADAFLSELRSTPNVIALSYHVDYWDYLGWKDTLGSPAASQRQYDYAHARGDMNVYTPQMIVDGRGHIVGSNRPAVLEAIRVAQAKPQGLELNMDYYGQELMIEIGSSTAAPEATVWLMPVIPQVTVKILKGEIAGREMVYHNVVRTPMAAGMWTGSAKTLSLPTDVVLASGAKGCVAVVQEGKTGPVLGCTHWGDIAA